MAVGAFIFVVPTFVAVIGAAAVDVQGDTICPRPSEVAAALEGLINPGSGGAPSDVARLATEDNRIVVSLRLGSPEGGQKSVRSKPIPQGLSCAERATAAAIIIAAWEARLAEPPAEPLTTTMTTPAPAPEERLTAAVLSARSATGEGRGVDVGVSAAALLSMNAAGFAGGALLEIRRPRRSWPFGVSAGALVVDAHAVSLGAGEATWRRFGLTADVHRRINWSVPWLEARAGVVASVLWIAGRQYAPNQHAVTFDPGATAGLRVGLSTRWASPWLYVGAAFWPRSQIVYAIGPFGNRERLPWLEVLAGLGVSLGRGR